MRKQWKQGKVAVTPLVVEFWQVTHWEHGIKQKVVVVAVLVLRSYVTGLETSPSLMPHILISLNA